MAEPFAGWKSMELGPDAPPSPACPVLVFDVNETLLDLRTLEPVFKRAFGRAEVMREWFAQLILYSQTYTIASIYMPFGDLAVATLRMVGETSGVRISEETIADLAQHLNHMPVHADVLPALARLREAGFRLVTLTNSAPGPGPGALERAGATLFFERQFTVHNVGKFKPARECYNMVADGLGVAESDICMVACHLWDTIGAQAAGCRAALILRPGNALLPASGTPLPDIVADDLLSFADEAIRRWRGNAP